MSKSVTIAGTTFPVEIRPGATISFQDVHSPDPFTPRKGTVLDRAPQGQGDAGFYGPIPGSGVWLWVIPSERREGEGYALRVRYFVSGKRAGTAHTDRSPMVVRVGPGRYELRTAA